MEGNETQISAEIVMDRMENTLNNLEQMSYDSINTTDRLVTLLNDAKEYSSLLHTGDEQERQKAVEAIERLIEELLNVSFQVNNLSHQLEQETVYQRATADNIRQIIDFLYAMAD